MKKGQPDLQKTADKAISIVLEEVSKVFMESLREALAPMMTHFDIHTNDQFGPLTVFIHEEGFGACQIGATVTILKKRDVRDPEKLLKEGDRHLAGMEILNCHLVEAKVNLPAVNTYASEAMNVFGRAAMFTQIIRNSQQFLDTFLRQHQSQLGTLFLAENQCTAPLRLRET